MGEDGLNFVGGEQTVKGFLHEQFPEKAKISRNTEEVQAESISYAVCAYFGIETGENSFGYIATWSKGKELPELKASLETINHTASGLITDIDRNYKALMKERGLDKEPESLAAEPVQEITVQEPELVSAPDNGCVPDPAISVESMNAYGYTDSNMLPLTKERALELMERDVTVYMLHTDNTEAMAFDADEIRSFDGIFGVEVSEWGTVKDRFVPQDYEKAFLDNPGDSFAIYQLRDNDDTARLRYMNSEYLEKKGLSVQKENYAAVYAGDLDRRGDTQDKLNELYETFNIRRPEDFRGHSLSVSDIVALKQNGVVSCHYVDSWGFKELPGFLKPENYLKNAEMAIEEPILPDNLRLTRLVKMSKAELGDLMDRFAPLEGHFNRYLMIGGFPELVLSDDDMYAQRMLREDVVDKVIKRDVLTLFNIRSPLLMEKLFLYSREST